MTKTLEQLIAKVAELKALRWDSPYNEGMFLFTNDRNTKLRILGQLILRETGATDMIDNFSSEYDILKWYYES